MIKDAGVARLAESSVTVVGLGAVGSYATEALARAGVGRLRLIDFDEIRHSNLNRQLYALHSTIGRQKVDVAAERLRDINPACRVEAMRCFIHAETMSRVLDEPPSLVIDAIDSFSPKCELLAAVRMRGIGLVSSMGAALRTDPTCIRIGPMREVHHCPLAAKIRKRLRGRQVPLDFTCIYSIEPVSELPADVVDVQGESGEDTIVRGRQRRPLGSLPTLTGIFGLTAANEAIRMLLGDLWPRRSGRAEEPSR